jgi:GntR family transcriptional repressor for pyruvate dehydrogenase complex
MGLVKLQKSNISSEVYNSIIENIQLGVWQYNSKIPSEMQLAEIYGVSRVSVRNAVQQLVGQGILVSKHGEGTFISDLSFKTVFDGLLPFLRVKSAEIVQMYEFRKILEVGFVKVACIKATSHDILQLEKNYEEMIQNSAVIDTFVEKDIEFHALIAEASKNEVYINTQKLLRQALYPHQLLVQKTFGTKGAIKYHKLLLDKIKNKNALQAAQVMEEHLEMTIKNVKSGKQNIV